MGGPGSGRRPSVFKRINAARTRRIKTFWGGRRLKSGKLSFSKRNYMREVNRLVKKYLK